jgi:hypothetical protein
MASRLPEAAAAAADSPAPGHYHSPATAGPPPHAPSAPAFSLQGKARRGKSRLRQMLGKLADLGEALLHHVVETAAEGVGAACMVGKPLLYCA